LFLKNKRLACRICAADPLMMRKPSSNKKIFVQYGRFHLPY
jgi:hypothetical protein